MIRKFLTELKKKFGKEDNELTKIVKLKQGEQDLQTMNKFIWIFKHTIRGSKYKKQALIEEFKRDINSTIR